MIYNRNKLWKSHPDQSEEIEILDNFEYKHQQL